MPEYEFYCTACQKPFTAFMHVEEHDQQVAECPNCHQRKGVERRIASDVSVVTSRKS